MATVQDVITGAFQKTGILRKGQTPDATDSATALTYLNDILGSWSNESLLIYNTTTESFSITSASSYSIGTGQTLNTDRPMRIMAATVNVGGLDYEVTVLEEKAFQTQIALKSISTSIPEFLTYNNAFPYGTIKLWPLLSGSATLTLMSEKQITAFAATTTTFSMPPGWSKALKANLAVDLLSNYNIQPPAGLMAEAATSKGNLKRQAIKAHPLTYKDDSVRRFNIYTGY